MGYCTKSDVYKWIPSGSVNVSGRHVSSVSTSANSLTVDSHGFEDGSLVSFRAESGGALPSPLIATTTYYVIDSSEHSFSVSSTDGGTAINISTAGTNVIAVSQLPWDDWIDAASQQVDNLIPAHATPFVAPYPQVVINYTALIVASWALTFSGKGSDLIADALDRAMKELETWRKFGLPVRVHPDANRGAISRIVARRTGAGGTI